MRRLAQSAHCPQRRPILVTTSRCPPLALLSGRRHRVTTAVALADAHGHIRLRTSETIVTFQRLDSTAVDALIAAGDWRGKAGGYALQGSAEAFVRWLSGSWSGVVGLPLCETRALLAAAA